MNRIKKIFDLRGLNAKVLILSFMLNLGLTLLLFTIVAGLVRQSGGWAEGVDIILMLGMFFICGLVGFGVTLLARDGRGASYGVLGAIGGFILVTVLMFQSGLLAVLVALTALLGGYNGGMLGESMRAGRR